MAAFDPIQVVTNPTQLSAEVENYWTPQALSSAIPLPLPNVFSPRLIDSISPTAGGVSTSEMIVSQPVSPDAGINPTAIGLGTNLVQDLTIYPYLTVGKLFMTFGGGNYVGTAWVIGENTVCTAGHCVFDNNSQQWGTNLLFQAQYRDGSNAGTWALPSLATLKGWTEGKDFEFDMAIGISNTPIRPVTGTTGWIAKVQNVLGVITSVGYPAQLISNYNFNGEKMWECKGSYIDTVDGIMAMNNNMTGGCSGGPGFYKQSGQQYAVWINSFRYTNQPNILRSPYLGEGFLNLIQHMNDNGGNS